MRVLVTGADGFVGARLVRRLVHDGHRVSGSVRPGAAAARALPEGVMAVPLELTDRASVARALEPPYEAVVHLAAVASGGDARRDPGEAWTVNAAGTARLADALAAGRDRTGTDPLLLVASSAEVYGNAGGNRARTEADPPAPCSPYAASKWGAEIAALEVHRRVGLRVAVTRAFPHTGVGQDDRFVVPAFARRIRLAREVGAPVVEVGNLEPVRDFLHVDDVVDAYVRLLERAQSGAVYNIASGEGVSIGDVFVKLARLLDAKVVPETDSRLVRASDIRHLVGDARKLREATGWAPRHTLDDALREVIGAETD